MIYLASPYSHSNSLVRENRFDAVCEKAAEIMRAGEIVFSPIAHSHPMVKYGLPTGYDFWEKFDRQILAICKMLVVYCLPGWEESVGVKAEIALATELGIPVEYLEFTTGE